MVSESLGLSVHVTQGPSMGPWWRAIESPSSLLSACQLSGLWLSFPCPHSWATSCSHTSVSLCRESKELADLARLHPTSCAPNGLNPNLMVTGGPTLAGSGRWSADPAAHLATHPWLPRSGSTSMWLAGHPYGECSFMGFLTLREGRTE